MEQPNVSVLNLPEWSPHLFVLPDLLGMMECAITCLFQGVTNIPSCPCPINDLSTQAKLFLDEHKKKHKLFLVFAPALHEGLPTEQLTGSKRNIAKWNFYLNAGDTANRVTQVNVESQLLCFTFLSDHHKKNKHKI